VTALGPVMRTMDLTPAFGELTAKIVSFISYIRVVLLPAAKCLALLEMAAHYLSL
jgi:hypothetical protein